MTAADGAFSLACNGTAVALSVARENDTTYVLDPQQALPPLADGKLKPEVTRAEEARRARDRRLQRREPRRPRPAGPLRPRRGPDRRTTCARRTSSASRRSRTTTAPPARRRRPPNVTFTRLLAAIKAAGGPAYDYREIDPASNQDGGEPNGNIRVAFLFRTDNRDLQFVDRPGGDATTRDRAGGRSGGRTLSFSPGASIPPTRCGTTAASRWRRSSATAASRCS